jgi:hypothetical protein
VFHGVHALTFHPLLSQVQRREKLVLRLGGDAVAVVDPSQLQ